jgi:hypothetical protein
MRVLTAHELDFVSGGTESTTDPIIVTGIRRKTGGDSGGFGLCLPQYQPMARFIVLFRCLGQLRT